MPRARVTPAGKAPEIELEYETLGDPAGVPLLLVAGLGSQLIGWHDDFCALLAARGFHVVRFDNRDAGLSTQMDAAGVPDLSEVATGGQAPPYRLDDMADDAAGLLDALGVPAAHVVGASMGGFIAQLIALRHPSRVLSLTSIMSGPGGQDTVPADAEATALLVQPEASTRDGRIAQDMEHRRILKGSADPYDEAYERWRAERAEDRAHRPAGAARQLAAIVAAPSRLGRLRGLRVPTLVVHGVDDKLIPVDNGRMVASAVPGARLIEIEGMGHQLPERAWQPVVDALVEFAGLGARTPSS